MNNPGQWGLAAIRADYAYANLALQYGADVMPGSGQTIGFIDSGVHEPHPMFHGKRVSERFLPGAVDEDGTQTSHGTAVASVAAGGRAPLSDPLVSDYPLGVAWGADVAMFAIPLDSGGGDYLPISLASLQSGANDWVVRMNAVRNWRDGSRSLDFLNLSIGYPGIIDDYSKTDLETNFRTAIDAFAQTGARKTILVWSAGNDHGDPCDYVSTTCVTDPDDPTKKFVNAVSVDVMSGLVSLFPELQGHSVAVVSVGNDPDPEDRVPVVDDWKISDFSNRCGIAAAYCIAAPGMWVRTAYFGPHRYTNLPSVGYGTSRGTSFAAPMVTGGLAVMKHFFRSQLSNNGLLDRMFRTANKTGDYADSTIYGQGLMDLGAATSPVGVLRVSNGRSVDGPGVKFADSRFQSGAAFGDGFETLFENREIVAFDALGAPFWHRLRDVASAAPRPSVLARLRHLLARPAGPSLGMAADSQVPPDGLMPGARSGSAAWSLAYRDAPPDSAASHLGLAGRALVLAHAGGRGLTAAALTSEGIAGERPVSAAAIGWQPEKGPLGLRAGLVQERESVLGTAGAGAFGGLRGSTVFTGLEAVGTLGRWRIGAQVEMGAVDPATQGGMISDVSRPWRQAPLRCAQRGGLRGAARSRSPSRSPCASSAATPPSPCPPAERRKGR